MDYTICEKTGKRCYSKQHAQSTVNAATKKHWKTKAPVVPRRAYFCYECGWWHLTKGFKFDGNKAKRKMERRYTNERRRAERMEEDIYRYTREYR